MAALGLPYKANHRTVMGVKVGRFATHGSQWGPGKVHIRYWSRENRMWGVYCQPLGRDPYGHPVDRDTPVTCTRCAVSGSAHTRCPTRRTR